MTFLDFEKPIEELYQKLEKLQELQADGDIDLDEKIAELNQKIQAKKEEVFENLTPWQRVQLSRHPERPYTLYYIQNIFESFTELHGDRKLEDDKAIVGGLAKLDGKSIMIIGHQKGESTKMRQYRNFGMASPSGYRKAMRLMKLAEKFQIPVVTFIDTPGAYAGIEAEDYGQAEAIARNLYEMSILKTPIVSYVIGEGASGGAIGIGVADKLMMLENTWFTVISPESCSSILWRSWEHKEKAAEQLNLTANDMSRLKIVDSIVKEPLGGAHREPKEMAKTLKASIKRTLTNLQKLSTEELIEKRINKYASIGVFEEEKS